MSTSVDQRKGQPNQVTNGAIKDSVKDEEFEPYLQQQPPLQRKGQPNQVTNGAIKDSVKDEEFEPYLQQQPPLQLVSDDKTLQENIGLEVKNPHGSVKQAETDLFGAHDEIKSRLKEENVGAAQERKTLYDRHAKLELRTSESISALSVRQANTESKECEMKRHQDHIEQKVKVGAQERTTLCDRQTKVDPQVESLRTPTIGDEALPRSQYNIDARLLASDTVSMILQVCGLTSKTGDSLLSSLCSRITEFSTSVICVWVGYEMGRDNIPLFIAVMSEIDNTLSENFQKICQFRMIQRLSDEVSEEAKFCVKTEIDTTVSLLEQSELREAIVRNSEDLFKSHSKLLMISASSLKSSNIGNKIERKTCVVLYVHIKGIIPIREKPFPLNIGKFPVDVREGIVYMYNDAKLTIGCNIVNAYNQSARLGGFVRLKNGKVGCFTCWHMFDTSECKRDLENNTFDNKVFLRSKDDQLHHFGSLIDKSFCHGDYGTIGVDAALIEITDRLKLPVDGSFGTSDIPLNADSDQPSGFFSGEILTTAQKIVELQTHEDAICKIIRYDDIQKHMYICTGVLKVSYPVIDAYYPSKPDERCRLYAQMEIHPYPPAAKFADFGDSGALVFLVNEHTDDMWAIGMVVGGVTSGAGLVTPIWAILNSFNLPMNLLSFNSQRMKKIEQGMGNMQRQMERMQRQMERMHQQTQQALAEILKRLPPSSGVNNP